MSLRSTDNFASIMRFVRFVTSCVGANAYDPNYRINRVTIFTVAIILIYIAFTILTVIKEANWMFTLQAISMAGSVVQGINKMVVGVSSHRKIYELNQLIIGIYEEYESNEDDRFSKALLNSCHKLRRALQLVGMSYLLGAMGMFLTPIIAWKATGNVYLIMHYHIPGIDVGTEIGAWITQVFHGGSVVIGAIGMYAGDMVIIVHLLQSYVFADILRLKVDNFNMLVATSDEGEGVQEARSQVLRDIIKWHQTYLM